MMSKRCVDLTLFVRVHHCLGDGPAMVAACCTLCDNVDDLLIWGAAEGALRRAPVSKNMDEYYTALQVVLKKFMRLWLTREPITMLTHPGGIAMLIQKIK